MIQRIQTVYLLLALSFGIAILFMTQIEFTGPNGIYELTYQGINNVNAAEVGLNIKATALSILLFLVPLITLISIFLFKKRILQIRLCVLNIVLSLGTIALIYYFGMVGVKELHAELQYKISMIFPFAEAILLFLAIRGIGRDEALIRSMDRIR